MTRTLIRVGLALAGNAIGLLLAALLLDDMSLDGAAFLVAVVIFTVLTAVVEPLVSKVAEKQVPALQGGSALVATFLSLLLTALISDGLRIDGTVTWVIATVLVWLFTMIAGVVLAKFLLKPAPPA
jgi:uncharacterized membrane protein YvlD (DUF360 family)